MFIPIIKNLLNTEQRETNLPATSKVVCVGRNYIDHAKELNNPIPKSPLLFIKPNSSLVDLSPSFSIPQETQKSDLQTYHESKVHHELEVAILIGKALVKANPEDSLDAIAGIGLGLDLTLRELQSVLKTKGHPWEKAKAFDGACPMSHFIPYDSSIDLTDLEFSLIKNNKSVQEGHTKDMLFPVSELLSVISYHFSLLPGDIVMTGTPAGVAPLTSGDQLSFYLAKQHWCDSVVKIN